MIDEGKLIKDIRYANMWNDAPCPTWVINMIKAQPKIDTPVKKQTHHRGEEGNKSWEMD